MFVFPLLTAFTTMAKAVYTCSGFFNELIYNLTDTYNYKYATFIAKWRVDKVRKNEHNFLGSPALSGRFIEQKTVIIGPR